MTWAVTDSVEEAELSDGGEGSWSGDFIGVNWGGALALGVTEFAALC